MLSYICEDPFDITRDRFGRWNVVTRSACLHQRPESTVVNYLKGPFTLRNPSNDFRTGEEHKSVRRRNRSLDDRKHSPSFSCGVLAVTVSDFGFGGTFKSCCD